MQLHRKLQRGFTLIEMIVVMVITGILGGMIAIFISGPVQGYVDSARRAEMSDIADTAMSRLARDIQTAVPNSVRLPTPAGSTYIEFLPTKAGGRYRAGAPGDILNFDGVDTSFDILGPTITFVAGDLIVVRSGSPYDNSAAGVLRAYTGVAGTQSVVSIISGLPATAGLPSHRFEVVPGDQQAVTYACENVGMANGDGAGTLRRYRSYGFNVSQAAPPLGGSNAVLADKISSCSFAYDAANPLQLVTVTLGITRSNESISLYQEIHVGNTP